MEMLHPVFTAGSGLDWQQGPTDNKGTYFEPHKITFLKKILPCKKTAQSNKNIFLLTPKENSFFTRLSSNILCSQSPNMAFQRILFYFHLKEAVVETHISVCQKY